MALVVTDLQTQTQWALVAMPAPILLCACPFAASRRRRGERVEGGALLRKRVIYSSPRPLRLDRSWGAGAADAHIDIVRHGRGRVQ